MTVKDGWRFLLVDVSTGARSDAFDHDQLAAGLTAASGRIQDPNRLNIDELCWPEESTLEFASGGDRWRCQLAHYGCRRLDDEQRDGVTSPDGSSLVFVRDHDLWLRNLASGEERRLTDDGSAEAAYATLLPSPLRALGLPGAGQPWSETAALWSPDSPGF